VSGLVGGTASAATVVTTIGLLALATITIKATGPFLLGRRDLPERTRPAVALLPTALMTALVVVEVVIPGPDGGIGVDPGKLAGLAVACVGLAVRLPLAVVMVAAVVTTALVRRL
jgi:branched-subunit amino acid transport protein